MLGLSGVPSLIMLIGLLFMPESPRWLVSKGEIEKAKRVLKSIRNSDTVDEEIYEITQTIQKERLGKTNLRDSQLIKKLKNYSTKCILSSITVHKCSATFHCYMLPT